MIATETIIENEDATYCSSLADGSILLQTFAFPAIYLPTAIVKYIIPWEGKLWKFGVLTFLKCHASFPDHYYLKFYSEHLWVEDFPMSGLLEQVQV